MGTLFLQDEVKCFFTATLKDLVPQISVLNMPWAQFRAILRTGYRQPQSDKKARRDLQSLAQGNLSIPDLVREMNRLHALINPKDSEAQLAFRLTVAFRTPLKRICETVFI